IVNASCRMDAMIHDLLELAKSAEGGRTFSRPVALEQALAAALDNLGSRVQATGASITHRALPLVAGDAVQLAQVFQNLIGNSLKYRKPGMVPEIHVSAERGETEWVIRVRDNGIGFEAEQAEKIFRVFKRLHGAEYAGTGVGLAICKRIIERQGGRIWATSAPGEGAVFAFSIPCQTADPE
ncbi:MAG TPA: ATP-binding protein, partial [Bryobacteraceae bacterium]|nr:ATP-binding protein [Bryobacteraceae bacterium]